MTSRKRRPRSKSKNSGAGVTAEKKKPITIIHVDQPTLRFNRKNKAYRPAIVIRKDSTKILAHRVKILGPSEFIFEPFNPLPCGARLWIETEAEVTYT